MNDSDGRPAIELADATLAFGDRFVWSDVDLQVERGQFVTVLGPNGSGKSSLVSVILGLTPLARGMVKVGGKPPKRGSHRIGYVPQQRGFGRDVPLRARDLVQLGIDGHRWGLPRPTRSARIDEALEQVRATAFADRPVGLLSGGEQQRLRMAQALVTDPDILLCDEPLLSLDLPSQQLVVELLDRRRRDHGTAVVFVTHEINPVLPFTDRVLYLAPGGHRFGSPEDVMTSQSLTDLYGTPIDVLHHHGALVVLGAEGDAALHHDGVPQ